ncbi:MAG TPA: hypothetical protein VF430_07580 [Verrucomicrobiae bacterium]|jgi:hypothetical protein
MPITLDEIVEETRSGKVKGIPAEEVSARIQKMLGRAAINQETP